MDAARTSRNSASSYLSLISQKKVPPQNAREVLIAAFEADDYADCIRNLAKWEIDPQAYVDGLDQIISTLSSGSDDDYYHSLRELRRACGIHGVLPTSFKLPYGLTLVMPNSMERPFASGGFSDVWKARDDKGEIFAVKHFRTYRGDSLMYVKKKYCKEAIISRWTRHKNVLSIEGVAPDLFQFCMVSRWMDNGNLLQYVNSMELVDRMALLIGITRGLHHLHSNQLIYGDLKGSNILIDSRGNPLLADFGHSSITKNDMSVDESEPLTGGTIRWAAPELLDIFSETQKKSIPTVKSDVYALSMVIIELYTGDIPFPNRPDPSVILFVAKGGRPSIPVSAEALGLNTKVWELTKRCWHKNPEKRPNASQVLLQLETSASRGKDDKTLYPVRSLAAGICR